MKNVFKLLLLLSLIVYLVFAFTRFNQPDKGTICRAVNVTITDSAQAGFISADEVTRILKAGRLYPMGRPQSDINGEAIQQLLKKNPFIADAVCYKAPSGDVNISVTQRLPVMRVIADNGDNYFIDGTGNAMPRLNYTADVVVATGHITEKYARRHLARLGRHLQSDPFWNDQTQQINVDEQGNMELIPRAGDQVLYLGQPVGLQKKLAHLKAFYEQAMNTIGWNKYSRISAEFDNQIICTKK